VRGSTPGKHQDRLVPRSPARRSSPPAPPPPPSPHNIVFLTDSCNKPTGGGWGKASADGRSERAPSFPAVHLLFLLRVQHPAKTERKECFFLFRGFLPAVAHYLFCFSFAPLLEGWKEGCNCRADVHRTYSRIDRQPVAPSVTPVVGTRPGGGRGTGDPASRSEAIVTGSHSFMRAAETVRLVHCLSITNPRLPFPSSGNPSRRGRVP